MLLMEIYACSVIFRCFTVMSFFVLRFFGNYPAMDIPLFLPECHGSEIIFDWSRRSQEGRTKRNNR